MLSFWGLNVHALPILHHGRNRLTSNRIDTMGEMGQLDFIIICPEPIYYKSLGEH
jgi:hypothetical protein